MMTSGNNSTRCNTLSEALTTVFKRYGTEVLNGEKPLHSIIADFLTTNAPQGKQSLNLLRNAVQVGIPARIYDAIGKDSAAQSNTLSICKKLLIDNYGVSDNVANEFVNSFGTALEWKILSQVSKAKPVKAKPVKGKETPKPVTLSPPVKKSPPIDPNELYLQAMAYYFPKNGMPQDYKKAAELFKAAADQGHLGGQFFSGNLYEKGNGVPQNYAKANYYYQLAADRGVAEAQYCTGRSYTFGKGVAIDIAKAVYYYQLAVDQGYDKAQFALGYLYLSGQGVPKDLNKAKNLFQISARQGNEDAKEALELLS